MGKRKAAGKHWLLLLPSDMIWEWESVQALSLNFQSTGGNESKNNSCRKIKCWADKKIPMFSKPDNPFGFPPFLNIQPLDWKFLL